MKQHQITIDIAAYGWQGESWQGFYPADLPEDWRLDFYSNEHRAVVVPVAVWQSSCADDLEDWLDAVHDEFRFYFEAAPGLKPSDDLLAAIAALGGQFGGWIVRNHNDVETPSIWYEGIDQPRQMREAIDSLRANLGEHQHGVIVVNSTDEPWQVASDMRQLVELMGYG
ncbi:MAG: hypothetical protein OQK13_03990 [Gammaproteobacteria bacterium]|nr:hypothetical protein [Gammaproteobacteria bacterium]